MNHIYLDANSTTPMDEAVRQVMIDAYGDNDANPASQHRPGQVARRKLEDSRSLIASLLGAQRNDRLIFTSGGTESDNLAVIGIAGGLSSIPKDQQPEVIISAIEHPAVLGAADFLASRGFIIHKLPADVNGVVDLGKLEEWISPATRLVSLMLANNETGVLQNVSAAVDICRTHDVPVHCDAVQAIGKIPVGFRELGVAAMTITAHKIHGPRGIGGLLVTDQLDVQPLMFGGVQQLGQRPGTEDIALAAGFAKSVELATELLDERSSWIRQCRDRFERLILAELPTTHIHGLNAERLPHTSNLSFLGEAGEAAIDRQALMMAADIEEVAISTGSACTSGSSEASHVLTAMGCEKAIIDSSIRISFSASTTNLDVTEGARRIIMCVKRLRQQKSRRN